MNEPLIALLPGMGADGRLFDRQSAHFKNVFIPKWIPPRKNESLSGYARRMAETLPESISIIGGCSLGGMIAVEMARHHEAKACILIASVRSPKEFPRRIRMWRAVAPLAPVSGFLGRIASRFALVFSPLMRTSTRSFWKQLAASDRQFFRWATRAVLAWKPGEPPTIPIYQIHGDRDHVLPHNLTHADVVVPGGGHLIPMTHATEVNAFIEGVIEETLAPEEL